MRSSLHYSVIVLVAFIAACLAPGNAAAQRNGIDGSFTRTLNVSGTVDLDVATGSGSIDIKQGSGSTVEIRGTVRVGTDRFRSDSDAQNMVRDIESNPPIEQTGNSIHIGRNQADRDRTRNNVSISYEITIPSQASVRSNSGSGRISVSGLNGPLDTSTGSGSITLTDIRGRINASTGSGSINATRITSEFIASTGSGGITVEGEQTGRWNLETGSGSVNIRLPQNAGFDLNAHTGSGGVYGDFPITLQAGKIDRRQNDLSGKVRGGGYALDVRTGSGSIRID